MKTIARLTLKELEADETHVEAFKALGHLTRLQVFFYLVRTGREVSVGEIQATVESRKEERYIYYSVQRETATTLARLLTACC